MKAQTGLLSRAAERRPFAPCLAVVFWTFSWRCFASASGSTAGCSDDPVAFAEAEKLVRGYIPHFLLPPARPPHHHPFYARRSSQSKQGLQLAR